MAKARGSLLATGLALAVCFSAGPVIAQKNAMDFLKKRHEEVIQILSRTARTEAKITERNHQLNRALEDLLDFDELSRRSLRDHWEGLSQAQRDEFTTLLRSLVERSYQKNLESTLDYEIRYEREEADSNGVVVHTVAHSKKKRRAPEVEIDYKLRKTEADWKVFDVTTDGVSLIDNYRNQFNRIIRRHGWNELIARMQKRLTTGSDTL